MGRRKEKRRQLQRKGIIILGGNTRIWRPWDGGWCWSVHSDWLPSGSVSSTFGLSALPSSRRLPVYCFSLKLTVPQFLPPSTFDLFFFLAISVLFQLNIKLLFLTHMLRFKIFLNMLRAAMWGEVDPRDCMVYRSVIKFFQHCFQDLDPQRHLQLQESSHPPPNSHNLLENIKERFFFVLIVCERGNIE